MKEGRNRRRTGTNKNIENTQKKGRGITSKDSLHVATTPPNPDTMSYTTI